MLPGDDENYKELYFRMLEHCTAQEAVIARLNNGGSQRPVSNAAYQVNTLLQYKVKRLEAQLTVYENGQREIALKKQHAAELAAKDRDIKRLKRELGEAYRQGSTIRKNWEEVTEDIEAEHDKIVQDLKRRVCALEARVFELEGKLAEESAARLAEKKERYRLEAELEKERENTQRLQIQMHQNYENSSVPSSQTPNRTKIVNNREKSGKKPGGQQGHVGHRRPRYTPTQVIEIPAPEEYSNNPEYRPTGKTVTKQSVGLRILAIITEYTTPEFIHISSGRRVHAAFPEGLVNEVSYDGSVKAFAFLLNNHYNVAIAKVRDLLSELTGGTLTLSVGMINGLSKEFAQRTEVEQKKTIASLLCAPVLHTDFTSARVCGKQKNVLICASGTKVVYLAREQKGHKGIKDSPVEKYLGTLVHDHDRTFYNYGRAHQECLDHVLRYLKASMEYEPNRIWNRKMHALIREMIHFRKHLDPEEDRNPDQVDPAAVAELERRYDEALRLAKEEYEYEPPSDYYRDGFNLYTRLLAFRENHLLFLHDRRVSYSNSVSERLLRIFKRKQHQAMTFRSFDSLAYLCAALGSIASLRAQGKNVYEGVAAIFDAPLPKVCT